ncbi:mitochondrial carrier domain-containing protein [Fomitopsis betulina]|nr:mitochondrial carrier domain-containing protein [Fomitopsis betulina]
MSQQPRSTFPTPAIDHAFAGLGAGVVAVLCMHPLDLLKIKFQVATDRPQGGLGKQIWRTLKDIKTQQGWQGLYRGVGPNIAGNASSWGLYFLFYNMLKNRATGGDPNYKLSSGSYLLYSAEASAVTAVMTNPIWVVKVRMFTTRRDNPQSYRGLWDGLRSIYRTEGVPGLYRGTLLALFGVSNGAIQFMAYEKMKDWGFERKRQQYAKSGRPYTPADDKLSNTSYTMMSGVSKLWALSLTYPYQVVRSRIQNNATAHLYPTIRACIRRTFAEEGARGFYRGLGTNLVRVLPGTCVTFVVYENLAWLLRTTAARREERKRADEQSGIS